MRRRLLVTSLICAGTFCAGLGAGHATTVTLPVTGTTLYLQGDIPSPFWMTFGLDANVALSPSDGSGYMSHYVLNVHLTNGAGKAPLQFVQIEGAAVDNGFYPDGPPRLLFSDSARTLFIAPSLNAFNATVISVTLTATLPDGLYFTSEPPEALFALAGVEEVAETPLPAAAPLFAAAAGAMSWLTWRRRRKSPAA